jgi:hypothetical protein
VVRRCPHHPQEPVAGLLETDDDLLELLLRVMACSYASEAEVRTLRCAPAACRAT